MLLRCNSFPFSFTLSLYWHWIIIVFDFDSIQLYSSLYSEIKFQSEKVQASLTKRKKVNENSFLRDKHIDFIVGELAIVQDDTATWDIVEL